MFKRKASMDHHAIQPLPESNQSHVEIMPLGAGNEVGRSCIILKYQGKTVMFDCGIHPGLSGFNSLPYLDSVDLSQVDVALITHFHLDHCAAVPFLLRKTKFKGRTFMTHPTKAIYHSLLRDFARSSKGSSDESLYDESDLDASMDRIEVIDFLQTVNVNGIQITPYRAGHVLGAAMFCVEIAGMRCLYTGDYSRAPDRHMPVAEVPSVSLDIVIVESTYGVSRHLPSEERERLFTQKIHDTVMRGGRVLLPVVAMGRSQELLLLLDEYWQAHPELHHIPIFQASGMMRKALTVYQTYVEMMNDDIRRAFSHHVNPFDFRHVTHLKNAQHFDHSGSCVLMATPSGLQSGVSRDVFDAWCDDDRNSVIICDYAVQGTLAREILSGLPHVLTKSGVKKNLKCQVDHISFSAHADFDATSSFLDATRPPNVVLVHGEATGMGRLKGALESGASKINIPRTVFMPRNNQPVQIHHKPLRSVRMVGRIAEKPKKEGQMARGVLVTSLPQSTTNAANSSSDGLNLVSLSTSRPQLMHPDDLTLFSKLHRGRVTQRQAVAVGETPFSALRLALEVMFEGVEGAGVMPVESLRSPSCQDRGGGGGGGGEVAGSSSIKVEEPSIDGGCSHEPPPLCPSGDDSSDPISVRVGGMITVTYRKAPEEALAATAGAGGGGGGGGAGGGGGGGGHVVLEWEGGQVADVAADAVVAVLLQAVGEGPDSKRAEADRLAALQAPGGDPELLAASELRIIAALLGAQFGPSKIDDVSMSVTVVVDEKKVRVDYASGEVHCPQDEGLAARVDKAVNRIVQAMRPCPIMGVE